MNPCDAFRRALESALTGQPGRAGLVELGWHQHLLACGPCRLMLEQEEALELLLASLPEPVLPPELATRVLDRLRIGAERALDELLDLDQVPVPAGLAERVRAGTAAARAAQRLEALLERAGLVEVPPDLHTRVLAGLAAARASERRGGLRLLSGGPAGRPLRRAVAAAALVAVLGGAGLWLLTRPGDEPGTTEVALGPRDARDAQVIAWLPVLEYWDALRELGPLEAEIVTRLDEVDEALLEEGP